MKTLRLKKKFSNKAAGDCINVDGATAGNLIARGVAEYAESGNAEAEKKATALEKELEATNKKLEAAEKKLEKAEAKAKA